MTTVSTKLRRSLVTLVSATFGIGTFGIATAQACEIQDYEFMEGEQIQLVHGSTTCEVGVLSFELYEGENLLTEGSTYIGMHRFAIVTEGVSVPDDLRIEYTVD